MHGVGGTVYKIFQYGRGFSCCFLFRFVVIYLCFADANVLVVGDPAHGRGLKLDDPFQPRPFCDSMNSTHAFRGRWDPLFFV